MARLVHVAHEELPVKQKTVYIAAMNTAKM